MAKITMLPHVKFYREDEHFSTNFYNWLLALIDQFAKLYDETDNVLVMNITLREITCNLHYLRIKALTCLSQLNQYHAIVEI